MKDVTPSLLLACALALVHPVGAQTPPAEAPAVRPIEFPAEAGEGQPREVKVLHDDPAVKLVTITLRKGTVLPAHSAPVPVTIQALRGAGTIVIGDARHRLDASHAIVLPAGTSHAVEPDAGTSMVVLVHHLGRAAATPR